MKQKILFILLTCLFTQLYSQVNTIDFQLALGPTLSVPKTSELTNSNVSGSPEIKSSINIGVFILPSINYSISEKSSIDFGIGYYLDRFSIEDKIGYVTYKGNRNIHQIQTPINFNFHFGNDKSYQFGIGTFANFTVSAKEKGDSNVDSSRIDFIDPNDPLVYNNISIDYEKDLKDNYNSVSFGAFLQLKKSITFSSSKKGFVLLKINQYIKAIKNNDTNSDISQYVEFKNEKEPMTVNLGVGLIL
ncbi:outer membrane beta-barrel protein [Winogradskyella schleiferi]|uniref:outer membrane beta-barrel protein n=1 Tax=Winogradskyella schleiferi TaxID=2686078 RepID=UPI0015BAB076|nr:outer membrane beta-barrel protein [Winogradskyella schleiferi]